ncbi:MAG: hypothetical protein AAFR11_12925 [Pseudomonadota bacterium]
MTVDVKKLVSFAGGVPLGDSEVLLIGMFDDQIDVPHTVLLHIEGEKRKAANLDWSCRAIARSASGDEVILAGLEGETASWKGGELTEIGMLPIRDREDRGGAILCARTIADSVFLAGFGRQVYRKTGAGPFRPFDHGTPGRQSGKVEVAALEAIDGFSSDEVYAAGKSGEIWRYDGATWRSVSSPTNLRLMGLRCAGDGYVYICGQAGLLIRGRHDQWEVLHADQDIPYFWDLEHSSAGLLIASTYVLYRWTGDGLEPFPFPDMASDGRLIPKSFRRLAAHGDAVWSIGEKDVVRITPAGWNTIL